MPQKALTLSREVDECKPLIMGGHRTRVAEEERPGGAQCPACPGGHTVYEQGTCGGGLHSSTSLLNLSRFCH